MTVMRDARAADHGARCAADNRADRARDNRASGAADHGARGSPFVILSLRCYRKRR
jgi:hypothetical protein